MEYEGLTYVTVRGAGHEVPLHRPEQAFFLFKQFLKGEPMPAEASFNYFRHTLSRNTICSQNL
jgi:hydroxymandelonitrile lyase/serine carboxypeptidase-like clade 2